MELADPNGSYAVLVGSSRYDSPTLEDLPAVAGNVRDLGRLLMDPTVWGLPPGHCIPITDPSSHEVVLDAVHEAAQRATDSLLVYYAGHGLPGPDGDGLLLALPTSDTDRPYSWLDYRGVRREVLNAGRRVNRMVILDCCYSGQALIGGMSGSVTLTEQARIAGTYLLTATSANSMALSPPGKPHTAFTGALIRLLDQGLPRGGPLITAPELYDHLLDDLRSDDFPLPQQRLGGTGHTLVFARNRYGTRNPVALAAPAAPARAVPERLRDALRAQPRLIAEHASRWRTTDPAGAAELLTLAATTRPAQEAAALVCLLRGQMRTDEADFVLAAAASQRAPADLAACIHALRAMDDDGSADMLLRTVAKHRPPQDVAATIRSLRTDGGGTTAVADAEALLAAAVAELGTTEAVLDLAGALWSAQLDDCADQVLRAPSVSSSHETARLAEALSSIGRVEEALALYVRVFEDVVQAPSNLVRVLRLADEAGRPADADRLLTAAAKTVSTIQDIADLCDALWAAGMGDRAGGTLAWSAGRLATDGVIVLADVLHAQGHDEAVLQLFAQAALHRPVADTPVLVAALRTMGRPLDARRLLLDAAGRPVEDVAELFGILDDQGAVRDRARVRGALPDALAPRARLIRLLHVARRSVEDLLDPLLGLSDAQFDDALRLLRAEGADDVAGLLLRHLVRNAPDRAAQRLEHLDGAGSLLLDRVVLRALLQASDRRVAEVRTEVIVALVGPRGRTIDERVAAIGSLCEAGLTERVEEVLADATRHEPRVEIVNLIGRMEARGLTAGARAVVRSASWMFSELYRDFVLALLRAGLRDLAVYALESNPERLSPAQREQLVLTLGIPAPGSTGAPSNGPAPPPKPSTPLRLRDRLRRH
ncbi:caspase family protein [Streptomyces sp. NPDC090445]|uniref:caspase, EACC1-associated type n=1 Tax=Streptomyces sp. NPDC090445 TaxID=3365963 RepID=UPI003817E990